MEVLRQPAPTLAIVAALPQEVGGLLGLGRWERLPSGAAPRLYSGAVGGTDIVLSVSGVGQAAAESAAEELLRRDHPGAVLSLGLIEGVADRAITALSAEASGAMWAVFEQSLDYAKTRSQFGQTLSSFQALQHRLVDLYMICQLAQSMVLEATLSAASGAPGPLAKAAAAAKAQVGDYARTVGQEGVQLHGGVGMTMELPIGHYLKRLTMINATLGDPRHHLRRYGAMA